MLRYDFCALFGGILVSLEFFLVDLSLVIGLITNLIYDLLPWDG